MIPSLQHVVFFAQLFDWGERGQHLDDALEENEHLRLSLGGRPRIDGFPVKIPDHYLPEASQFRSRRESMDTLNEIVSQLQSLHGRYFREYNQVSCFEVTVEKVVLPFQVVVNLCV